MPYMSDVMLTIASYNTKLRQRVAKLEAENAELWACIQIMRAQKANEIFELEMMYNEEQE